MDLGERHCVPCRSGTPPLQGEQIEQLLRQLPDWRCIDQHHLERVFPFKDFAMGLEFVNRVGAVAEEEGHHPDLCLAWGRVQVITYTHSIKGLSESDFILAAKVDRIYFNRVVD